MLWKVRHFLRYYFKANTIYGIHSPYAYGFIRNVLDTNKDFYAFQPIEVERKAMEVSNEEIEIQDYGSGSKVTNGTKRTIREIVKSATSGRWKCRLLFNIARRQKPKRVLELGTNLGIGTSYLASASANLELVTIEADKSLYQYSLDLFKRLDLHNIKCVCATFDDFLANNDDEYDLIYIDGNHKKKDTIDYFNRLYHHGKVKQVIILDDIDWSYGMAEAWNTINSNLNSSISIDMFKIGIILADPELEGRVQKISYIPYKYKPWNIGLFP